MISKRHLKRLRNKEVLDNFEKLEQARNINNQELDLNNIKVEVEHDCSEEQYVNSEDLDFSEREMNEENVCSEERNINCEELDLNEIKIEEEHVYSEEQKINMEELDLSEIKIEMENDVEIGEEFMPSEKNCNLNEKLRQWFAKHTPTRSCALDLQEILKEEKLDVGQFYSYDDLQSADILPTAGGYNDLAKEIKKIVWQQTEADSIKGNFPLTNEESLRKMDLEIKSGGKDVHIKAMRAIFKPGGILKNLHRIFSDEFISSFNIKGVHGKKSLDRFENFYSALIDSISSEGTNFTPEALLRKAIQLYKKRIHKRRSLIKRNENFKMK